MKIENVKEAVNRADGVVCRFSGFFTEFLS